MLDASMMSQLRDVFSTQKADLTLSIRPSTHARQDELLELAWDVAAASVRTTVKVEGDAVETVRMDLLKDGAPTGVSFRGVPGGHEFTSLVVALINADGRGRLPDEAFVQRIRALQGGAVRTYISQSCTNCPDVVQALNLVALLNPAVSHQMVDGALHEDEVAALGIQGVPAVFLGDVLVHVGKASLAELVEALEKHLGRSESAPAAVPVQRPPYDVTVVGGGPAGVAAAIYSARKGLRTALVAQKIGGQVQETLGIENFIGVPRTEGPQLTADLLRHLRGYDVDVLEHRRVERVEDGALKAVHLQGGERLDSRQLIVASGAKWRELNVPGEKEYLGRGVAFCPHCDGPFYKGMPVAVVGGGNSGVEAALDLANICEHVTLLEFAPDLKADAVLVEALRKRPNVRVITHARTTEVLGDGTKAQGLRYENRATGELHDVKVNGVFVQIGLTPNSAFVKDVVETNRYGEIVVDEKGRTRVPGIYAAGDVTQTPFKQIVIAMGEGAKVALTAFEDRMRAGSAAPAPDAGSATASPPA
jgi:alkyl hydroperoxide reductase subunit F